MMKESSNGGGIFILQHWLRPRIMFYSENGSRFSGGLQTAGGKNDLLFAFLQSSKNLRRKGVPKFCTI